MSFIKTSKTITGMSMKEIQNLSDPFTMKKRTEKDREEFGGKVACKKCEGSGFVLCKSWKHEKPCHRCNVYKIKKKEGKIFEGSLKK